MSEKSKVVLITGASSGMGEAVAIRLAREGAKISLAARREDRLQQVAERVRQAGGESLVCATDLARLDDIQAMVRKTMEAFGRIDVVFNGAGLLRMGPIETMSHEDIAQQVNINVLGAVRVIKEVVPILKKQNSGLIINVSSVLGRKTRPNTIVYTGTKWAVTAMNECLREELLGTKIRTCVLQPGVTETELFDYLSERPSSPPPEGAPNLPNPIKAVSHPLKADEIAELVAFIVDQPWHFNINEVLVRPTEQIV